MPALDSHHMRARLHSDLGTAVGRRLIEGWLGSFDSTHPKANLGMGNREPGWDNYQGDMTAKRLADNVAVAEAFYVTENMMILAEHAWHSMPTLGLQRVELPAEAGFLWLPRSMHSYDVRGRRLTTRALQWHQYHGQLAIVFWTERDDPDDEVNAEIRHTWYSDPDFKHSSEKISWDSTPKLQLQHMLLLRYGKDLPTFPDTSNLHRWRSVLPGVEFEPGFDDEGQVMSWTPQGPDHQLPHAKRLLIMNPPTEEPEPTTGFLAAFFRLCGQQITTSERVPVDRAARRRSKGLPNSDAVTVINLRHASVPREHGESQVEWSHRWLRRGHWRNAWYGSGENKYQSPIWISEAVCGPEDKPLIIRDHVTQLSR